MFPYEQNLPEISLQHTKVSMITEAFFIPPTFLKFEKIHHNEFQTNLINSWSIVFSYF